MLQYTTCIGAIMKLERSIGTTGLLFIAVGGVVGSGWLFGPYFAAKMAGPAAILSWVLGGILVMMVAFTFAELSSTFPVAGGMVRFPQLSHGPLISFTMAWVGWLASIAVAPVEIMALIHYATNFYPWLMHSVHGVYELTWKGVGIASLLMLILCAINAMGVRFVTGANNGLVIFKLAVPIITLTVLLLFFFQPHNLTAAGFAPMGIKPMLSALPSAGIVFSFIGYSTAIQMAGETKNPMRSVPIALLGGLLICIILYTLLQVSFIGSLHASDFSQGWQSLHFSGDAGPFAGIAAQNNMTWLVWLIYASAIISPLGTALIYTASTERLVYAVGENGYLPLFFQKLTKRGVSLRIIFLNFICGVLLFLPFPTWQSLVSFLVSALVFSYAVGPLALPVLRRTLPHQPRPFRLPMHRVMCILAFYISNLVIYWTGWAIVSKMMVAILLGYVILLACKRTPSGRKINLNWNKAWWMFPYLVLMTLISYWGSFGGQNKITFGWDFVVIAMVSFVIFEMALWMGAAKARFTAVENSLNVDQYAK